MVVKLLLIWYSFINSCTCHIVFSNLLIIHKEKTKEITTVTVVWIPDLNKRKILQTFALNFSKNYEWFEKPYQKLERVFHQVSKHSKSVKKLGCASFFQPTSRGLDILMKHSVSCLIYYFKSLFVQKNSKNVKIDVISL